LSKHYPTSFIFMTINGPLGSNFDMTL